MYVYSWFFFTCIARDFFPYFVVGFFSLTWFIYFHFFNFMWNVRDFYVRAPEISERKRERETHREKELLFLNNKLIQTFGMIQSPNMFQTESVLNRLWIGANDNCCLRCQCSLDQCWHRVDEWSIAGQEWVWRTRGNICTR